MNEVQDIIKRREEFGVEDYNEVQDILIGKPGTGRYKFGLPMNGYLTES